MKNIVENKTWLILLGTTLTALSHLTYNIEILAWIAWVPFLVYLDKTRGFKSRLLFVIAYILAWSLAVSKIINGPIPWMMVPAYSLPIALFHMPAFIVWMVYKDHRFRSILFSGVFVLMEWVQHTLTPIGSWGAAAYTQVDSIILLQSVSLFGMAGLSFLIYIVNAILAESILNAKLNTKHVGLTASVIIVLLVYGSIRYDHYNSRSSEHVKVAAVSTDSQIGGIPLPDREVILKNQEKLFERTTEAANAGARFVVWNEASTVVMKQEEDAWQNQLAELASMNNINLASCFIVLLSEQPFRYENKIMLFNADGKLLYEYNKHIPVPGEPAVPGTEEIRSFSLEGTRVGGAICYDYDFPGIAKKNERSKAEIVFLPSSDWRGIDPIHTKMAALRAIEQGHSILRSTRFGLSAAINPIGEFEAKQSSFDSNDKIMTAYLPINGRTSLYSLIGDAFIYILFVVLALIMVQHYRLGRNMEG